MRTGLAAVFLVGLLGADANVWGETITRPVAVFDEPGLALLAPPGAAEPSRLVEILSRSGHYVVRLDAAALADPKRLNRENVALVVLPYGPLFPAAAADNFKAYLKQGGKFVSLGGYAFSQQVVLREGAWVPAPKPWQPLGTERLVRLANHLEYAPDQIPIFSVDYALENGAQITASAKQQVFERPLKLDGTFTGWAATACLGMNRARWVPLLECRDRYGRYRGAAAAMLRVFPEGDPEKPGYAALKQYSGTSWAFFGLDNVDLLSLGAPAVEAGFARLVDDLVRDVYIAGSLPVYYSYRQGESPVLEAVIANGGHEPLAGKAEVAVFGPGGESFRRSTDFALEPGKIDKLSWTWDKPPFESDFYRYQVTLLDADGEVIDRVERGFAVWDDDVIAKGSPLVMKNNYMALDGRNRMLFGTDDGPNPYTREMDDPLAYLTDVLMRRDGGIDLYENLQQYTHWEPWGSIFKDPVKLEKYLRRVDAMVQLCHKYGQVYMMGMLICAPLASPQSEWDRHAEQVAVLAERYAHVPRLIWYLNGDIPVPLVEVLKEKWNLFLREKYGTDEALRKAWGELAPKEELGAIPLEQYIPITPANRGWTDAKASDAVHFQSWVIRRWTKRLADVIRRYDRAKPITCEFFSGPGGNGVDVPMGVEHLDISNIGFFGTCDEFDASLAYSDCRSRGKSMGVGEFGGYTHPLYDWTTMANWHPTRESLIKHYLTVTHACFGLGANHVHSWRWKPTYYLPEPWGMLHSPDRTPRAEYYAFRNTSFFTRTMPPLYSVPRVALLESDSLRLSAMKKYWRAGHHAILKAIASAIAAQPGEMLTLNESYLRIPQEVEVIFYPLAYTVPDDVWNKLKAFVRKGGVLYLSGDPCYDPVSRKRIHPDRLQELCGVRLKRIRYTPQFENPMELATYYRVGDRDRKRHGYPSLSVECTTARRLYATEQGEPVIVTNRFGTGTVVYSTDPSELKIVRISCGLNRGYEASGWRGHGALTLTYDMKTAECSGGGSASAGLIQTDDRGHPLTGGFVIREAPTKDWRTTTREFTLNGQARNVNIGVSVDDARAEVLFDNIRIVGEDGVVLLEEDFEAGISAGWEKRGDYVVEVVDGRRPGGGKCLRLDTRDPNSRVLTVRQQIVQDARLYREVLGLAGVKPVEVEPYNPLVNIYRMPLADGGKAYVFLTRDDERPLQTLTVNEVKPAIRLSVRRGYPAVLRFDPEGRLVAAECDGELFAGEDLLVDNAAGAMILTLDGRDIGRSRNIAILPVLRAGRISVPNAARWRTPSVSVGEFINAEWKTYEVLTPTSPEGEIVIPVDEVRGTTVMVLSEQRAADSATALLAEKLFE